MYSLAINSCVEPYGVSLLQNDLILGEVHWYFTNTQKNDHFYAIDYLFKTYNLDFGKLEFISIINGPGSFTGLRIGFSIIKTIGFLYNLPIIPISIFEVITKFINLDDYAIIVNAGLKEVFIYKNNKIFLDKLEKLVSLSEVLVFPEYKLFDKVLNKRKIYFQIESGNVGKIGFNKFKEGYFEDYKKVLPLYLREPESIYKVYKEE